MVDDPLNFNDIFRLSLLVMVKVFLCAMKVHGGSGGVATYILNLGIRWMWVISFVAWPGYHWGESCLYSLNRSLGGCNSASLKCFAEEINLLDLLRVKQQCLSHPACSLVTISTLLSWFVFIKLYFLKHFKVACWQNFHHLLWFLWILGKTETHTYEVVAMSLYVPFIVSQFSQQCRCKWLIQSSG